MVLKHCIARIPFLAMAALLGCREPTVFNETSDPMGGASGADSAGAGGSALGGSGSNVTGNGGVGGSGGEGGSGGDGGVGGSGGQGGSGGIPTPGGSGGSPGCDPKPENCFNGVDDDCDTKLDCSDTDCGPQARCVLAAKDDFALGVSVGVSAECPAGYGEGTIVKRGLRSAGECEGCSCTISETKCEVGLSYYKTEGDCGADINPNQAADANGGFGSCTWLLNGGGAITGAKLSSVTPSASCDVKGTAKPKSLEWGETLKFCKRIAGPLGGGCGLDQVCVAKADAPACVLKAGDHACPKPYASAYSYFTSVTDTRACSACGCSVKGGACPFASVSVHYGHDCNTAADFTLFGVGNKLCATVGYGSVARYNGQVEAAACSSSSQVISGSATPTGQTAFCCTP